MKIFLSIESSRLRGIEEIDESLKRAHNFVIGRRPYLGRLIGHIKRGQQSKHREGGSKVAKPLMLIY
jgi:hypothetical protein